MTLLGRTPEDAFPLPVRLIHRLPLSLRLGRLTRAFDAAEDVLTDLGRHGGPRQRRERELRGEIGDLVADRAAVAKERDRTVAALHIIRDVVNGAVGDPADEMAEEIEMLRRRLGRGRLAMQPRDPAEALRGVLHDLEIIVGVQRDYPNLGPGDDPAFDADAWGQVLPMIGAMVDSLADRPASPESGGAAA